MLRSSTVRLLETLILEAGDLLCPKTLKPNERKSREAGRNGHSCIHQGSSIEISSCIHAIHVFMEVCLIAQGLNPVATGLIY